MHANYIIKTEVVFLPVNQFCVFAEQLLCVKMIFFILNDSLNASVRKNKRMKVTFSNVNSI